MKPDLTLIHLSRLIPVSDHFYAKGKLREAVRDWPRFHARDGTEEWVVNREPGPTTHGAQRGT